MHILRDIITPTWGDPITPTTQGTLITRTYTYSIPETIGSPNGVEDDLIKVQTDRLANIKKQNELANAKAEPIKELITIDDFAKLDIRVGKVLECERVPKMKNLFMENFWQFLNALA